MSEHPHTIMPHGISRKRKEVSNCSGSGEAGSRKPRSLNSKASGFSSDHHDHESSSSNRLLAGYMAYEFLTKGTLLGQKFDPDKLETQICQSPSPTQMKEQQLGYSEVANILKTDGAHIPGIVNPTQLSRWIQM